MTEPANLPWIDPRKWEPPPEPAGWLPRPALAAQAGGARLVVLAGGPGAGKTQGLRALARSTPGRTLVWLTCDEDEQDPTTLALNLAGAFERVMPGFAPLPTTDARAPWLEVLRRMADLGDPPLDLALDDAHHAFGGQPERWRALIGLLSRFPANFRVLVATSASLPTGLARAEAGGLARQLGPAALAFEPAEAAAFLDALAPGGRAPDAWRARAEGLDGWPLGLALVATGVAPVGSDSLDTLVQDAWLGELAPEEIERLAGAAALGDLAPEAMRVLLGIADPAAQLADWQARFLVVPFGAAGHRLASPLVAPLMGIFAAERDDAERAAWHTRAAEWFEARDDAPRAIAQRLAAGDPASAAALLHGAAPALAASGRHATIGRWLTAFPAAFAAEDPRLRYWTGQLRYFEGRLDEALAEYEAARRGFARAEAVADETKAIVRAMTVAAVADDARAFGRWAAHLQARGDVGGAEDRADALLLRALMADRHGDTALMEECNRAVLAIVAPGNVEVLACQAIAHGNLFTLDWQRGDLVGARHHAEAMGESAWGEGRAAVAFAAGGLLAHLDVVEGDAEAARQRLAGWPAGWEEGLDWHDRAVAWTVVGREAGAAGEHARAEQAFGRAERLFRRAGLPEGRLVHLEARLWHLLDRGDAVRACALVAAEPPGPPTRYYDAAVHVPALWARALAGDPAAAHAEWPALIEALDAIGARYLVAMARVLAAATAALAGQDEPALRLAAEGAVAAYPFLAPRLPAAPTPPTEPAAAPAAAAPSGTRARSAAPKAPAPAGGPAAPPAGDVDAAAGPLRLRLFGAMEVLLGDQHLDAWPRRKARWLLAALALHRQGLSPWVAAEVLEDPQLVAKNGNLLRVNIGALRRVLEPGLAHGEDSRWVVWDDGGYRFAPDARVEVDVWDFEALLDRADAAANGDPELAASLYAEAMALVRGDLLDEAGARERFVAERENLQARARSALAFLARRAEAVGDVEAGGQWHGRAAALAPTDAEVVEARMAFHARTGRPDLARRAYWEHRQALKAALGMAPDEEVEAAFRALPEG